MTSLVSAALTFRKTARTSYALVFVAAFAFLVLLGVFEDPPKDLGAEHWVVGAVWAVVAASCLAKRLGERRRATVLVDLELGLLGLVAAHAVVQMTGGTTGPYYPLIYVLVAFVSAFARPPSGMAVVLSAVAFEAGLSFLTEGHDDPLPFALHATFIVLFGGLNLVFTRAEIARVRKRSRHELAEERAKVKEEARLFRFVGTATERTETKGDEQERLFRSSIEEVHQGLYHVLDLLKRVLELHTCVLLLLDEEGKELRIAELVTDCEEVAEGPFATGEGAVGAVARRGQITNLEHIKPGYKGLCYYRGPSLVRAFVGVPVTESGKIRGALCADRLEDRPFSAREEAVLTVAVNQILRTVNNERVFVQLERKKHEQTILHRASQSLGAALSEEAVIDAGLEASAQIAAYDFAAITFFDAGSRKHSVRKAVGEGAEGVAKLTFHDNTSLTAMAVKNRHYLPYRGEFDAGQQVVFTRKTNFKGMESLLIMPLVVREDAIGALVLAAHRRDAFTAAVRPTLQVLANQIAVSVANAQAVRRLEELATTDGLTGCLNKRAFLDELASKLKSAERFQRTLSLIVTDIDHFKSVNDTYGHATGDVVIKELGEILRRVKRETDVVARFGGEEFCILCEETDTEGARLLAERVREELKATAFQTELGKVQVTCSLGVATFPRDAATTGELFELADQALYVAKRGGRDQVCIAD